MKLIFAQGNPGSRYASTRHNVGWQILDILADAQSANWVEKSKFQANVCEFTHQGEKVILAKPTTFYNDTGLSARALIDFYKLDPSSDVLVVHDELATPLGDLRVREKGRDAGNNGIKSLNAHIGENYKRIRVGVGSELRRTVPDTNFVLGNFTQPETDTLKLVYQQAIDCINQFISGNLKITKYTADTPENKISPTTKVDGDEQK